MITILLPPPLSEFSPILTHLLISFVFVLLLVAHLSNLYTPLLAPAQVTINMVLIFFASIHCPSVIVLPIPAVQGGGTQLVENDCVQWWTLHQNS